ncbi:hypothetical protein [Mariniluteicoccus flavus]
MLRIHAIDHLIEVGAGDAPVDLGADCPRVRRHAIDLRPVPGLEDDTRLARWDVAGDSWDGPVADLWADGTPVLLLAVEWLDDLPCVVAGPANGEEGPRVELGPHGAAGPVSRDDDAWLNRWWPSVGTVDVGRTRDSAWLWFAERLPPGSLLVALDYGHTAERRPRRSTLTAHRDGRAVEPGTPDANLTAHVAVDSLADAVERAGAERLALTRLRDLPVALPDSAGLHALALRSELALWRDPARFGDFWWIVHRVADHNGPHA